MNVMWIRRLLPIAMFGLGAGCTVGEVGHEKKATATMEAKSGSTISGTATFLAAGTMVSLTLHVSGATPGPHGVHLHVAGDCSAPDASSAMGHWDPSMMTHGLPAVFPHHLGDCGNFTVGADGTGTLTYTAPWTLGSGETTDVVGHAIIVHQNMDDGTAPAAPATPGNSGPRQACGVITLVP
jgi:Cu-Zn family superoxide dismutase